MKKLIIASCILASAAQMVVGQSVIDRRIPVGGVAMSRQNDDMRVAMEFDASSFRPTKDREYIFTPVLVSATCKDSVELEPFVLSGRNLYYRHLRNGDDLQGITIYKWDVKSVFYSDAVAFQPWMSKATLKVNATERGCCDGVMATYSDPVARMLEPKRYKPQFVNVTPVADSVKEFKLEGSAFINFPVNRTELYPEYMNNPAELKRIIGTIDSVKSDPDVTITSIFIKGFASPEGSYTNNVRLAKGRTATLKQYVENLYHFAPGFITTDFLPEDWPGLRAYLLKSAMPNRDAILALVDSELEPDAKDAKIKKDFPSDYAFLLATVYPSLRHSDYVITYNIKSYTTLEEIIKVLHEAPHKLSLNEFYRAAQSFEAGSAEYNEVFETAVHIFPYDETANLNAANSAMLRNDFDKASKYLNRAGDSPQAIYARGVLAAMQENFDTAEQYFAVSASHGCKEAAEALAEIKEMKAHGNETLELINDK